MAFKMKGYGYPGKSPIKNMKTGSYKHSFEDKSPLYQDDPMEGLDDPVDFRRSPMKQWTYPCPECGLEFETFPELSSHIQSAHLGGGDPTTGPDRDRDFGPVEPGGGGSSEYDDERGPLRQDSIPKGDKKAPGHGGDPMPDILYKPDGTAVKVSNIDEELLDLRPSIGPKGRFVNYTDDDGTVIKYYYKKP